MFVSVDELNTVEAYSNCGRTSVLTFLLNNYESITESTKNLDEKYTVVVVSCLFYSF